MANPHAIRSSCVALLRATLVVGIAGSGCGSGSTQPPATDAVFRRIQRHEAQVHRAFAQAQPDSVACPTRCAWMKRAVASADEICELAKAIDDADAETRCERAMREARGLRDRVRADCDCNADPASRLPADHQTAAPNQP